MFFVSKPKPAGYERSEHKGGTASLFLIGKQARQRAKPIPRESAEARKKAFCTAGNDDFLLKDLIVGLCSA